jgi:hypothetical protein
MIAAELTCQNSSANQNSIKVSVRLTENPGVPITYLFQRLQSSFERPLIRSDAELFQKTSMRLYTFLPLPYECYIMAVIYMRRYYDNDETENRVWLIWTACVYLAMKMSSESVITSGDPSKHPAIRCMCQRGCECVHDDLFAKMADVPVSVLRRWELNVLKRIDYKLWIDHDEYDSVSRWVSE